MLIEKEAKAKVRIDAELHIFSKKVDEYLYCYIKNAEIWVEGKRKG